MSTRSDITATARGRFSDAKTAGSAHVDLRLDHRGIVIDGVPGSADSVVWPYGALATDMPVSRHSGEALITYRHMPNATLYVDDHDFVVALCREAGHLTTSAHRWRWARPLIVAAALVCAGIGALWFADVKPARAIATVMPERVRIAFGEKVIHYIAGRYPRCVAPAGRRALDKILVRLIPEQAARDKFDVIAVDWSLVNAFAAPGGRIVVTSGLIRSAQSANEVAGVIAHEIGHGIELHPEAGIVRAVGLSAIMDIMLGGSSGTLGSISGVLIQNQYAREDERAADMQALRLLKGASVSQKGLAAFFTRIANGAINGMKDNGGPSPLDLLRTHPRPGERAVYVSKTPSYPTRPLLRDNEWQALKTVCSEKVKNGV